MADSRNKVDQHKSAAISQQQQIEYAATKEDALTFALGAAEQFLLALEHATASEKKDLRLQAKLSLDKADQIKKCDLWKPSPLIDFGDPIGRNSKGKTGLDVPSSVATGTASAAPSTPTQHVEREPARANSTSSELLIDLTPEPAQPRKASQSLLAFSPKKDTSKNGTPKPDAPKLNTPKPDTPKPDTPKKVAQLKVPVSTRRRARKEEIILLKSSAVHGFKFPPWEDNPPFTEFEKRGDTERFRDVRDLTLSFAQRDMFKCWARPDEALPPPLLALNGERVDMKPLMHADRPVDLVQDAVTDCSVVASLCAASSRTEDGFGQMLSTVIWPQNDNGEPILSPNGKYIVRLQFNGCWRKVVIDDRLPISKNGRLLHVADRKNPSLLWPALLEKAYLKLHGGYDFPGSSSCNDIWTLTGWIPEEIHLNEAIRDELWNRVYQGFKHGDVLVTLGTGRISERRELSFGLEGYHSYVVLRMKEDGENRLFQLKNPWLDGKGWCGPPPPGAPTDDDLGEVEANYPQAATFWMDLDQVLRCFETLYLNWNPGLFRHRQDIHFEWDIDAKQKTSGCVIDHPQFSLSCSAAGDVWLILSRHVRDNEHARPRALSDGSSNGYISLYVCEGNGNRVYHKKENPVEQAPYVSTPQCLLRFSTNSRCTYTVIVDQEELLSSKYSFSLSAFSTSKIFLEQASERYGFHIAEEGAWTDETAGGATQSPSFFKNPQFALEIRNSTSLTALLTSTREVPLNVKLVRGRGDRVYQLKSRDILSDSGDYKTRFTLTKAALEPGTYTIICSLFEAGRTGDFTLRVDSTSEVGLKCIPRDGAGLLRIQTPRLCFAPNVRRMVSPLTPKRLASIEVVSHFRHFASPVASPEQLRKQPRSLLRISIELGRGPDRRRLATSESGEFSDTEMLRTERINVEPKIMAWGQQPWVVVERLSTPGSPIEEFYTVELLTNMPAAFDYGQWREWEE